MDKDDVIERIQKSESQTSEFKRKIDHPGQIGKQLSALSNAEGGVLFIGIEDNGKIVGVESDTTLMDQIANVARACSPSLAPRIGSIEMQPGCVIVFVEIERNPIVTYKGSVYLRVGPSSIKLEGEGLNQLIRGQMQPNGVQLQFDLDLVKVESKQTLLNLYNKGVTHYCIFAGTVLLSMFLVTLLPNDYLLTAVMLVSLALFLWWLYLSFKYQYLISLWNKMPGVVGAGEHLGGKDFLVNYSGDTYFISQPKAACIEPFCDGEVIVADRPVREKYRVFRTYVGKCSVADWDHSYEIDSNFYAKPAKFDRGPIEEGDKKA